MPQAPSLLRSVSSGLSPVLWRGGILFLLTSLPVVLYLAVGAYLVWKSGEFWWVLWTAPLFWGVAWGLSKVWKPRTIETFPPSEDRELPEYWTERDRQAWQLVTTQIRQTTNLTPQQLTDLKFYQQTAEQLALTLAKHYHPKSSDPVSSLTVPEILAVIRLVADDMEDLVLKSVPGSKLITVGNWRMLSRLPGWANAVSNTVWAVSIFFNPATALRYLASKVTLGPISESMQQEVVIFTYTEFVKKTGGYLIEMYSGRLQDGATTFRHLRTSIQPVTLLLLGQAKAGKSSLINALLGEQASKVDVIPCTDELKRYELSQGDGQPGIIFIDSPGYADAGMTRQQLKEIHKAMTEADAILLVVAAHQPSRDADRKTLQELKAWYADHPEFKLPPVVAVLTHIDRLSPSLEWSPPYNWLKPERKKEQSIRGAIDYCREVFGDDMVLPVPVRTDDGHLYGIEEELLPAIASILEESRAGAMLRNLHRHLGKDRLKDALKQTLVAGRTILTNWLEQKLSSRSKA